MKVTILALLFSSVCWSYPQFISYGYNKCISCHYNPYGNGPLTDYGRAVSATVISSKQFHSKGSTDEKLSDRSGFFFRKSSNSFFRPSFDYRGLGLIKDQRDKKENFYLHMQTELNAVIQSSDAKYVASFTHAFIPSETSKTRETEYYAKDYYIGFRPSSKFGLYIGRMDKVFGIRVADHTQISRRLTKNDQYSASDQLMIHSAWKYFEFGISAFEHNDQFIKQTPRTGVSGKFEFFTNTRHKIGFSYMLDEKDSIETTYTAIHGKHQLGKMNSLIFELGQVESNNISTNYSFVETLYNIIPGGFFRFFFEYAKTEENDFKNINMGPGFRYFPFQRLELNLDFRTKKLLGNKLNQRDSLDLTGQIHIWL